MAMQTAVHFDAHFASDRPSHDAARHPRHRYVVLALLAASVSVLSRCCDCSAQSFVVSRVEFSRHLSSAILMRVATVETLKRRNKQKPGATRTWKPYKPPPVYVPAVPAPPSEKELETAELLLELRGVSDAVRTNSTADYTRALDILEKMKARSLTRGLDAWYYAYRACVRAGAWEEADKVILAMITEDRLTPEHRFFHAALDAMYRGQENSTPNAHAENLLQDMQRRGMVPTMETYTKAVEAVMRAGDRRRADSFFAKAEKRGLLTIWINRGVSLRLFDMPKMMARIVLKYAVEQRALSLTGRKAGKRGITILTADPARGKKSSLESDIMRILKEDYKLKAKNTAGFGRIDIRGEDLERLGKELLAGDRPPSKS
eukprot:TRINITY_DN104149_c0_g1_i1.p1 TRINITY_DN104149_c0_g1~~TRINITY_DN104149_c0_g1_i1.p1  ORF type:complete len:375 (-),score=55.88 TRINITY_DN104149_c0_g1_i1:53-1177(-)